MLIGEAVAALGVEEPDDRDLCVVVFRDGRPRHAPLRTVAHRDIGEFGDVYLASGAFERGSIRGSGGRSEENLREILWLPFDADLADYLGCDKADLFDLDDAALDAHVARQQADLEEAFAQVGLPIHRLDYTGYGLCAYVRVSRESSGETGALRAAHRRLVARVNEMVGDRLLDPQVSDAGTRITRLPPCLNTKGATPRRSRTIATRTGEVTLAELSGGANTAPPPPRRVIPAHAKGLPSADLDAIAEAIAPAWSEGQRHALALAVSGLFAKSGAPEAQALGVVERLSAGDGAEAWDRRRAVATSYERVRSGLDVRGFTSLQELLPPSVVAFVDGKLGRLRQTTAPKLSAVRLGAGPPPGRGTDDDDRRDAAIEAGFSDPGLECYRGVFGEYVRIMAPTSEACDQFHLGAMLTLTGAMIGRSCTVEWFGESLYANLYTVLIGRTGRSRKDTAIKRALGLPQHQFGRDLAVPRFQLARDVSSAEGLIQVLKDAPNTLLYLTELTTMLRNARRKGTTTILDRMIEAWDTPDVLQNLNKHSPIEAHRPYLSVIAATQPSRLADNVTDEDIQSGFANRWLFVPGRGKPPMARGPAPDWRAAYDRVFAPLTHNIARMEGRELALTTRATERWDRWYFESLAVEGRDEAEDDMRARHANLAIKIALSHAVAAGAPDIDDDHLAPAIAIVEWQWGNVKHLMRLWGVGLDSQIAQRIVNQLTKHGAMKRRDLARMTSSRKWGPREFDSVLKSMINNGTVAADAAGYIGFAEDA